MNKIKDFITRIVTEFNDHNEMLYATQAAFYFLISAVPFIMFLLTMFRFVYPLQEDELMQGIYQYTPDIIEPYVTRVIHEIYSQSTVSLISVTAIFTLWAASKSTYTLALGLKEIYKTNKKAGNSVVNYIKRRLISLPDTLILMVIMIASFTTLLFDKTVDELVDSVTPDTITFIPNFLKISNIAIIMIITIAFTCVYKFISKSKLEVIYHIPGAFYAALGWMLFSYIYVLYFDNFSNYSITYGALAAIVVLMLWLKTCMIIFLFGAQLNMYFYERKHPTET